MKKTKKNNNEGKLYVCIKEFMLSEELCAKI